MAMKYRYVSKNGKYKIRWRPGPIDAIMMAHRAQRICGNVAAENARYAETTADKK